MVLIFPVNTIYHPCGPRSYFNGVNDAVTRSHVIRMEGRAYYITYTITPQPQWLLPPNLPSFVQ